MEKVFEALERLAMPDDLRENECKKLGIGLTEDYETVEQYILKIQEQEKVLRILKEKCLHNDNLNYVAVCINYDMYKEKMSKKYNTEVVKINWNNKDLLDYLKLLTQREFELLKEMLK